MLQRNMQPPGGVALLISRTPSFSFVRSPIILAHLYTSSDLADGIIHQFANFSHTHALRSSWHGNKNKITNMPALRGSLTNGGVDQGGGNHHYLVDHL
jgi:hypothetical protein